MLVYDWNIKSKAESGNKFVKANYQVYNVRMLATILIIEDDLELQKYLKQSLTNSDFNVRTAKNGTSGLELFTKIHPDLILLDLTLPDIDGDSVCRQIRQDDESVPVIMLTAKDDVSDKVKGLSSGADDYVTKPFNIDELVARIKTRLRVSGDSGIIQIADLVLDPTKIEVKRAGQVINLTPQEFKLLEYLMKNKGKVLTREMILNRIWLMSPDIETRVVDVYMGYLRKKVDSGFDHNLLHSIRGFGYTIKE